MTTRSRFESPRFLARSDLDALWRVLREAGYRCIGPRVREGAISMDALDSPDHLPWGWRDRQAPGAYRLEASDDAGDSARCFAWANGPQALKPLLFRPREILWRALHETEGGVAFEPVGPLPDETSAEMSEKLAVIGARACDLAALALHDRHFLEGEPDRPYAARRAGLLVVAVDCGHPADTCFCVSTGDGPTVSGGADIALTELAAGYLVRAYGETGAHIAAALPLESAGEVRLREGREQAQAAAVAQTRGLPGRNLRDTLFANLDHPRWDAVARRCLSCGNCVAVCPTCFCSAERDVVQPTAAGGAESGTFGLMGEPVAHVRQWDSCFTAEHSFLHGRPLRPDTRTRYRQWLTHKLGGWHDQYGRSGCVGCGRCIAWCPVGIDITEEAAALCGATVAQPDPTPEAP